jgi:hypothetical protein
MLSPYKQCRAPASMAPYNLPQHPRSTCPSKGVSHGVPYSAPRVSPRLAPLPESRYEKYFSDGIFVKNVF